MARYNRASGPPADFELTGSFQDITGLSITRNWDDGELFIAFVAQVNNTTLITVFTEVRVLIDGVVQNLLDISTFTLAGQFNTLAASTIIPINQGPHTIKLQGFGDAVVGDLLFANFTSLSVIQLPLWDSDKGIT